MLADALSQLAAASACSAFKTAVTNGCSIDAGKVISDEVRQTIRNLGSVMVSPSHKAGRVTESRYFADPAFAALGIIEQTVGIQVAGLDAAAGHLYRMSSADSHAKNKASKMAPILGQAEGLERHFTQLGSEQWLQKLRDLLIIAFPNKPTLDDRRHGPASSLRPDANVFKPTVSHHAVSCDAVAAETRGIVPHAASTGDSGVTPPPCTADSQNKDTDAAKGDFPISMTWPTTTFDPISLFGIAALGVGTKDGAYELDNFGAITKRLDELHQSVGYIITQVQSLVELTRAHSDAISALENSNRADTSGHAECDGISLESKIQTLLAQDPTMGYRTVYNLLKKEPGFGEVSLKKVQSSMHLLRSSSAVGATLPRSEPGDDYESLHLRLSVLEAQALASARDDAPLATLQWKNS